MYILLLTTGTVGYLFLFCFSQVSHKYKITTKTRSKGKVPIDGFPFSDTGDGGLKYIKCILESLM